MPTVNARPDPSVHVKLVGRFASRRQQPRSRYVRRDPTGDRPESRAATTRGPCCRGCGHIGGLRPVATGDGGNPDARRGSTARSRCVRFGPYRGMRSGLPGMKGPRSLPYRHRWQNPQRSEKGRSPKCLPLSRHRHPAAPQARRPANLGCRVSSLRARAVLSLPWKHRPSRQESSRAESTWMLDNLVVADVMTSLGGIGPETFTVQTDHRSVGGCACERFAGHRRRSGMSSASCPSLICWPKWPA